jgi:hypothetical protein
VRTAGTHATSLRAHTAVISTASSSPGRSATGGSSIEAFQMVAHAGGKIAVATGQES